MQLKSKALIGLIQPLSYLDQMLRQQGFYRVNREQGTTYDVVIYDSATSTSYFLRIPTSFMAAAYGKGELNVRLGQPFLEARVYMNHPVQEPFTIPPSIRQAAEHKLAEIADYLSNPPADR